MRLAALGALALLGNCVADLYRVGYGLNWHMDRKILADVEPTIRGFFAATTRGDVAAASSFMLPGATDRLARRVAQGPADFRVKAVRDLFGLQIPHHHPFVIGADLDLEDGRTKVGRFQVCYAHDRPMWVIMDFELGDTLPATPKLW